MSHTVQDQARLHNSFPRCCHYEGRIFFFFINHGCAFKTAKRLGNFCFSISVKRNRRRLYAVLGSCWPHTVGTVEGTQVQCWTFSRGSLVFLFFQEDCYYLFTLLATQAQEIIPINSHLIIRGNCLDIYGCSAVFNDAQVPFVAKSANCTWLMYVDCNWFWQKHLSDVQSAWLVKWVLFTKSALEWTRCPVKSHVYLVLLFNPFSADAEITW